MMKVKRTCSVCLGCLMAFVPGSEHPPMSAGPLADYPLVIWLFRHINICLEIYKVLTVSLSNHRKTQIRKDHNLQHNNCMKCFWLSLWGWSDFVRSLLSCCTINTDWKKLGFQGVLEDELNGGEGVWGAGSLPLTSESYRGMINPFSGNLGLLSLFWWQNLLTRVL